MDEHNLSQIVNNPTREQNYLDLTFMKYKSYLNRVETLPPWYGLLRGWYKTNPSKKGTNENIPAP